MCCYIKLIKVIFALMRDRRMFDDRPGVFICSAQLSCRHFTLGIG